MTPFLSSSCTSILIVLYALAACASEVMMIGTILSNPALHNLRIVTLVGTATNVRNLAPGYTEDFYVYSRYSFTLSDESGHIDVEVLGSIDRDQTNAPVVEGERISLVAQLQAWDQRGEEHIRAIAHSIQTQDEK